MRARNLGRYVHTAVAVPRWALGFYGRHAAWVVGISLIPSLQRFVAVSGRAPALGGAPGEVITAAARLLLVALVVRTSVTRDPEVARLSDEERRQRTSAFLRRNWPSLLVQLVLLGAAGLLFDVVPEQFVAPSISAAARPTYTAVLLAVKNPTVIAFTMIWLVGAYRQTVVHEDTSPSTAARRVR